MTWTSSLRSDTWHGQATPPYDSGTQVRVWREDGSSLDDWIDDMPGATVGEKWFNALSSPRGNAWVEQIDIAEEAPGVIIETIRVSSDPPFDATWSQANIQSSNPTAPGYVNVDFRPHETSATWWRHAAASAFINSTSGKYPWETQTPQEAHQCDLEDMTTAVCDLAGVPMTIPHPLEEMTVSMTWDSHSSASSYRTAAFSARNTRNSAEIFGYPIGTLLFAGASYRVSTRAELPITDLRFIYDPYGWCRQRAVSGKNGQFEDEYLIEVDKPSGSGCGDPDEEPDHKYAKFVYWVQLFPTLTSFASLLTSQQKARVEDIIT